MKHVIFCFAFMFVFINGFSQEFNSDKKYDFAEVFEQSIPEDFKFTFVLFDSFKNLSLLSFNTEIIFPIKEEKDEWKFGETENVNQYQPVINLGNFNQSILKIADFNVYGQGFETNKNNLATPINPFNLLYDINNNRNSCFR